MDRFSLLLKEDGSEMSVKYRLVPEWNGDDEPTHMALLGGLILQHTLQLLEEFGYSDNSEVEAVD